MVCTGPALLRQLFAQFRIELEKVLITPCQSLRIGTWTRVNQPKAECRLVAYICETSQRVSWFIQDAGKGFKISMPFDIIRFAELAPSACAGLSIATLHLSHCPDFFWDTDAPWEGSTAVGTSVIRKVWCITSDWTEGQQATFVLQHSLQGPSMPLKYFVETLNQRSNTSLRRHPIPQTGGEPRETDQRGIRNGQPEDAFKLGAEEPSTPPAGCPSTTPPTPDLTTSTLAFDALGRERRYMFPRTNEHAWPIHGQQPYNPDQGNIPFGYPAQPAQPGPKHKPGRPPNHCEALQPLLKVPNQWEDQREANPQPLSFHMTSPAWCYDLPYSGLPMPAVNPFNSHKDGGFNQHGTECAVDEATHVLPVVSTALPDGYLSADANVQVPAPEYSEYSREGLGHYGVAQGQRLAPGFDVAPKDLFFDINSTFQKPLSDLIGKPGPSYTSTIARPHTQPPEILESYEQLPRFWNISLP